MRPARRAAFSTWWAIVLVGARAAAAPDAAGAPSPAQLQAARDLFAAAARDEDGARWQDALEKLHRVAEVKLTAGVRYHIAFCEERLGQTSTALAHFTEARDAAERERSKDVLALLEDPFLPNLRARVPTLTLEVPADAAGATVTIDDRPEAPALWGTAVPIDPGMHLIEAKAPGRDPFSRRLLVREREVTVLDVVLAPIALHATPTSTPTSTSTPTPTPTPTPTSSPSHLAPILATTGSLALLGGGIAAYFLAASAQTSGQSQCAARTASCDDLRTPVRTWDAIALGAWIGSAALATTAIVLFTTSSRSHDSLPREGTSARFSVGPASVELEGSF